MIGQTTCKSQYYIEDRRWRDSENTEKLTFPVISVNMSERKIQVAGCPCVDLFSKYCIPTSEKSCKHTLWQKLMKPNLIFQFFFVIYPSVFYSEYPKKPQIIMILSTLHYLFVPGRFLRLLRGHVCRRHRAVCWKCSQSLVEQKDAACQIERETWTCSAS